MAVAAHYDTPGAWAKGADPAYEALGRAVVAASPVGFEGRTIADLGAGTGATSRAIAAAGGQTLAVDLALPMLAHNRATRPPAAAADITALPFGDGRVGGAVAAFSLSHVTDPAAVLREAARVTASGGPVLAGVFAAAGPRHEVSVIVDALAAEGGWSPPAWYRDLKDHLEPQVGADDALARLAAAAGLMAINVSVVEVDADLHTAEALVEWRLSSPAMAPFVNGLSSDARVGLCEAACQALGEPVQPLWLAVRILSSVAPATR